MRRRLHIRIQFYPCHCHGHEFMTWAIYHRSTFLCYSHSLDGAKRMLEYLNERF